jgi:hypothetical protein
MASSAREPQGMQPGRPRLAWRRAIVLLTPLLYVAGSAWKEESVSASAWLAIGAGVALALAGSFVRVEEKPHEARERVVFSAALALSVASVNLASSWAWLACLREVALLGAGLFAVKALFTMPADHGLAREASLASSARFVSELALERVARGAVALSWGVAALLNALGWVNRAPSLVGDATVFSSALGAAALFALGVAGLALAHARRFELSAPPRAFAASTATGLLLALALGLTLVSTVRADSAVALAFALACVVVVRVVRVRDVLALSKASRRLLTLSVYGGPVAIVAVLASEGRGAGFVTFLLAVALLAIGLFSSKLEEPFLPQNGRLLAAFDAASRAAGDRDTRAAIAKALVGLREVLGYSSASPELWIMHPARICTVDAAGYLKEADGELPPLLLDVARGEPSGTVRVDVLSALEVRRADLRPLLRWMTDRSMLFATIIADPSDATVDGLIFVPSGQRTTPVTIEEIVAAKQFADSFVAVCQARSWRERHLARERALVEERTALEQRVAALEHASAVEGARFVLAAAQLAGSASLGLYSASSRMAYQALERHMQKDQAVVVRVRPGMDPIPYVARAHLTTPRRERPLVVVDGTSTREHDVARWSDPTTSPLSLADGGRLVLVDGGALPPAVQTLIGLALATRRAPWSRQLPLDVVIVFTSAAHDAEAAPTMGLETALCVCIVHASAVDLPGLRARPEDLSSIVADRLAREGLRVRGRPLGIESAAFARLMMYAFEAEDAELAAIVTRLAVRVQGDVVKAPDVDALQLPRELFHE